MDRTANWCTGGCWFTLAVLAYPSFPIFDETINQIRVEYCAKTIDSLVVLECFSVAIEKGKITQTSTEAQFQFQNQAHVWYLVPQLDSGSNPVSIPVSRFQSQFQFQFPDFKPSSNSSSKKSNPVPVWFLDFLTASRTSNSNQPNQVTYLLQWFQLPSGGYVAQKSSKIFFFFF
jgi:hypothetical protein